MNKDTIVNLLKTNDKAVARAIVVLNERQTATEQASEFTINNNGVGFTPADARMGTSMAKFFLRNGYLSPKQIAYWRKPNVKGVPRVCKYAEQAGYEKDMFGIGRKMESDISDVIGL